MLADPKRRTQSEMQILLQLNMLPKVCLEAPFCKDDNLTMKSDQQDQDLELVYFDKFSRYLVTFHVGITYCLDCLQLKTSAQCRDAHTPSDRAKNGYGPQKLWPDPFLASSAAFFLSFRLRNIEPGGFVLHKTRGLGFFPRLNCQYPQYLELEPSI
jgi:hypothetical protein